MKKVTYISGPYSAGPLVENVRAACLIASELADTGLIAPIVPHANHLWDMLTPRPYEWWINLDMAIIPVCHAVFRLPGESPGADRETALALHLDIPVFHDKGSLLEWARQEVGL